MLYRYYLEFSDICLNILISASIIDYLIIVSTVVAIVCYRHYHRCYYVLLLMSSVIFNRLLLLLLSAIYFNVILLLHLLTISSIIHICCYHLLPPPLSCSIIPVFYCLESSCIIRYLFQSSYICVYYPLSTSMVSYRVLSLLPSIVFNCLIPISIFLYLLRFSTICFYQYHQAVHPMFREPQRCTVYIKVKVGSPNDKETYGSLLENIYNSKRDCFHLV